MKKRRWTVATKRSCISTMTGRAIGTDALLGLACEQAVHLATHAVGRCPGVDGAGLPPQAVPLGYRADEFDAMRQTQGEPAGLVRFLRRKQRPPPGIAALSVQHLPSPQIALGGGDHVGLPA